MRALVHHYTTALVHSFTTVLNVSSFALLCVPAARNLKVCAEVGGDRQSAAESLERAVGSDRPTAAAAYALHSPRKHGKKKEAQLNRIFIKKTCIGYSFVFVSALLPFSGRLPVCTQGQCVSAVHPAWPNSSPEIMQSPRSPGTPLWTTTYGGRSLVFGQTLWSYSYSYIQVHNITCSMAVWICG